MKEQFERYLVEVRGNSSRTIQVYSYNMGRILQRVGLAWGEPISRQNILANKFTNQELSSLRAYCEWLGLAGVVLRTDYAKVQQSYTNPNTLTKQQVARFLQKVQKGEAYRDYVLCRLLANTGLRISEALNIRVADWGTTLHIVGKGNKGRTVVVPNDIFTLVNNYVANERNGYKTASTSPYIFCSGKSEQLRRESVNAVFNKYDKQITPHKLRHYFATQMVEQGVLGLRQLQQQLGHRSLETTQIYTHPDKVSMRKSINGWCGI